MILVVSSCNSVNKEPTTLLGSIENFDGNEITLQILGEVMGKNQVTIPVKDGKFTKELTLEGDKMAIMIGGRSFQTLIHLKPGATTTFEIDGSNQENTVQITSTDKESQEKLMDIMIALNQLSMYSHPEWLSMSTEELDILLTEYDTKFEVIKEGLPDPYLKEWVAFSYKLQKTRIRASYVVVLNDSVMQKRYKSFGPNISFNKVVPSNDYAKINDFDFDNQFMLDVTTDIEMDLSSLLRMKFALNGKEIKDDNWAEMYIEMLEEITYQPLYDAFAYQAFTKYQLPDDNWGIYIDEVAEKISDTSLVSDMKKRRTRSIEKEERIKIITSAPVPTFTMETIDGEKKTIADFKGKFVFLDMWATWCGPCKIEIPHLQLKEEKYHDKVTFLSLSFDKEKQTWIDFVKKEELTGIQAIVGENYDNFQSHYMITGFPTFILLGKDGKVINHNFIRPSSPGFDGFLESIIEQNK